MGWFFLRLLACLQEYDICYQYYIFPSYQLELRTVRWIDCGACSILSQVSALIFYLAQVLTTLGGFC